VSTQRIAISQRVVQASGYVEPRDALARDWHAWCRRTVPGAVLLPIPNDPLGVVRWLEVVTPDAVILSGGNDMGESPERDETELAVSRLAIEAGLPLLGICRGLQVLNGFYGGEVVADVSGRPGALDHVARHHSASLIGDLPRLLGSPEKLEVNSFHNQGVDRSGVATELRVFAETEDGLVEGFHDPRKAVLAVQWHPEREDPAREFNTSLIARFLAEGAFWA